MKKSTVVIAVLLILSIANFMRIQNNSSMRAVEFISVFVMGALFGALLILVGSRRTRNKTE